MGPDVPSLIISSLATREASDYRTVHSFWHYLKQSPNALCAGNGVGISMVCANVDAEACKGDGNNGNEERKKALQDKTFSQLQTRFRELTN